MRSMNRESHDLEFCASDAFWQDHMPVEMAEDGVHPARVKGTPEHHLLFATSGSSGVPKWIAISKTALLASAKAVNEHLGVTAASHWGLALPPHHVGGFGVIARARAAGCGIKIYARSWNARAFADWAAAGHITHTSLVPTQVHDLVAADCRAPGGLVAIVVGGGRLDAVAGNKARALGWPVLASYGMTETASQIATQPLASLEARFAPAPITVLPHWQVRTNGEGCLEIAGGALFSGTIIGGIYQPRVGDWHTTHDRVRILEGGLVPQGRADALVKIAGELVDPQAVESQLASALQEHGKGIAVAAITDDRLGHRLIVAAERDVPPSVLTAAIDAHNASVPRSQRLGEPMRMDRIPRGALGKIQRSALLKMLGFPLDDGPEKVSGDPTFDSGLVAAPMPAVDLPE